VSAFPDAIAPTPAEHAPEERFVPEVMSDQLIEAEHHARYRFAGAVVAGRRVLDAGCGVGWGSQVLLDYGAASVDGVDIDESAVTDSIRRCPSGTFVRADLMALPFPEGHFDVIACFEAIEHVEDPLRGLDEFRRVLAPGGIVLVSSPNPDVYPAGNPFHRHELRPEDLHAAMQERFEHTELWRQHNFIASALHQDDADQAPFSTDHRVALLAKVGPGRDTYSVVVGSDAEIPPMPAMVALVSSRQLDDLAAAGEAIVSERAAYLADHERIVEERTRLLADHERIVEERTRLLAEHAAAHAAAQHFQSEVARLEAAIQQRGAELTRARTERDRAWLRLLDAEQELARSSVSIKTAEPNP
jgi:SAM-dependent methyltransferase